MARHGPAADPRPPTTTMTLSQALTEKTREWLAQSRCSQRRFAKMLGVTQGAVSYLLAEKRRATGLDFYERLASVFGIPLSALIADLEQRARTARPTTTERALVDVHTTSVAQLQGLHATLSHSIHQSGAGAFDSIILRAVLEALIDARVAAGLADIRAAVEAGRVAQAELARRTPPPGGHKQQAPRRRTKATERADDRTESGGAVRADAGDGEALSA